MLDDLLFVWFEILINKIELSTHALSIHQLTVSLFARSIAIENNATAVVRRVQTAKRMMLAICCIP
jgi:hypothetical protein